MQKSGVQQSGSQQSGMQQSGVQNPPIQNPELQKVGIQQKNKDLVEILSSDDENDSKEAFINPNISDFSKKSKSPDNDLYGFNKPTPAIDPEKLVLTKEQIQN